MKKAFNIIKTVLIIMIVVFAITMMVFTLISVNTFDKNDRDLFGYKFFVVKSDSMSATDFDAGDVILTKELNPSDLVEGDVITFVSQNDDSYGEVVTHKILEIVVESDAQGNPAKKFRTYGTTNAPDSNKDGVIDVKDLDTNGDGVWDDRDSVWADISLVEYPFILGRYEMNIPKMGSFFLFLKTTPGYIICILIPFLLLILSQGINTIRLFRRYKQEQMQEMQAEKDKIAQDKEEAQKMMAELLALKAQLEANGGAATNKDEQAAESQEKPIENSEKSSEENEKSNEESSENTEEKSE